MGKKKISFWLSMGYKEFILKKATILLSKP